ERTQVARVGRREVHVLHVPLPEVVPTLRDHGIVDALVPEDGDVPDVHEHVLLDDDVVHDVRAAPATPPACPDEADGTPPRDDRFPEAERHPADEGEGNTDAHATLRADERDKVWRVVRGNDA